MHRLPAYVAAAALITALTACAPGSPAPTPDGTTSATHTSSPAAGAAEERPTPGFGSGCDALVPGTLVAALSPGATTPQDLLTNEHSDRSWIPRLASIAQLRGLLCEWSNGEPYSSATGESAFRGIQLVVLPDAAAEWVDFATSYGVDETAGQVYCLEGYCSIDLFADGYWFNAEAYTDVPDALTAAHALADHLRAEAAGFGRAAEPWSPVGWLPVTNDCNVVTPAALVDEIFGAGHGLYLNEPSGGWSVYAAAWIRNGDWNCGWYNDDSSLGASWLNGGAWLAPERGATSGTPLPLTGLTGSDSATVSCDATECRVDLLVAGNWIIARAHGSADDSAAATRLAAHLVGVVRG